MQTNGTGNGAARNGGTLFGPRIVERTPLADSPPPQNLEAEISLLGSILLDDEMMQQIIPIVEVPDFYRPSHQIIFQAMMDLFDEGSPIDAVTLADKLISHGKFEEIGGDEVLRQLCDFVPHAANGPYYAQIIKDKAVQRRAVEAANQLVRAAHDGRHSTEDLVRILSSHVAAIHADGHEEELSINPLPGRMAREAFHGLAGAIIRTLCPQTEACAEALLAQFLVAFASAMGPRPHWAHGGIVHRSNLYLCLVGPTGEGRKGTSWGNIAWLMGRADHLWKNRKLLHGMTSGEGLIRHVRDNPGPVLAVETEFDGVLARMGRDGNTLSAVVRDAWDGPRLGVPTKKDPIFADESYLSIIGHITISDLLLRLKQNYVDNGLVNRFLWCSVYADGLLPEGGDFDSIEQTLSPFIGGLVEALEFAGEPFLQRPFQKTEAARELWRHIYCVELRKPKGGNYAKATVRAAPLILRLAVIYAVLDHSDMLRTEHVQAALAFWNYCDATAAHVFGDALVDSRLPKIVAFFDAAGGWASRTDVNRQVFHGKLAADELERLLVQAQSSGILVHQVQKRGTRDTHVWMHSRHFPGQGGGRN